MAGLNNLSKRHRIWKLIKKKKTNIICLQETYLRRKEEKYLAQIFKGTVYQAPAESKAKGVLTDFSKTVP